MPLLRCSTFFRRAKFLSHGDCVEGQTPRLFPPLPPPAPPTIFPFSSSSPPLPPSLCPPLFFIAAVFLIDVLRSPPGDSFPFLFAGTRPFFPTPESVATFGNRAFFFWHPEMLSAMYQFGSRAVAADFPFPGCCFCGLEILFSSSIV